MSQTKVEAPFVEGGGGGFKNVIVNGDMVISQRATGTTTISNQVHTTLDRFAGMESTDGTATLEQHSMSVADQATTGQRYAALWKCSGTDSSIGAAQYAGLQYFAEAHHLQHFLYGTSAAKDLTLSFWVKSNTTGTYSIGIYKQDNTGYYHPTTYAISSADTWEKKVIHISPTAGSTSLITASGGAIANDNGLGIAFYFYTALGTNYHTASPNVWSSSAVYGTSDQPNLMSSTDNNWYITGVQLEIGDAASDFEYIPFDVQLARCQRYCRLLKMQGIHYTYQFSTTWSRANPTYAFAGNEMRDIPAATWLSATPTYDNASQTVAADENKFRWGYNGATTDTSPSSTLGIDNIGFYSLSVYNNAINHSSDGSSGFVIWAKQSAIVLDAEL